MRWETTVRFATPSGETTRVITWPLEAGPTPPDRILTFSQNELVAEAGGTSGAFTVDAAAQVVA